MEDEKKKKRNKKKKNKQTTKTTAEDGGDQNHIHVSSEANDHSHVSERMSTADIQKNGRVDVNRLQSNGTQPANLAEAEKQPWLKGEAVLEETIIRLQEDKDHHIQKEATLEETIKSLRNESDSHMENLVTLEETIKQLQNENDLHTQKEVGLEMNIVKLQSEKDLWLQKESISKETIASLSSLNNDITRLQMQVTELEETRNNLLQENQQLAEHASRLQLQLQNLDRSISSAHSSDDQKHASEQEDLNAQIEAASSLVSKLITENAELVEKVNEFVKLHQQDVADRISSTAGSDPMVGTANAAEAFSDTSVSILSYKLESPEVIEVKEERKGVIYGHAVRAASTDSIEEIVQIPLDDNENQDVESQAVEIEYKDGVLLTDAPLIGAPLRLVSFVAKYVSGADLVNK